MAKRFYPAVLERDESGVFGLWFPDFPGAVAGGRTQEEALGKAQEALEQAMQERAERDLPLPEPSAFDAIQAPDEADVVTFLAVAGSPPDPSERVNVYLPRSVLAQADELAAAWGMSRSSLFGFAITRMATSRAYVPALAPGARKKGRRR